MHATWKLLFPKKVEAMDSTSHRLGGHPETRDALANIDDDDKLKLTKDEIDTVVSIDGIKCSVDSRVQSLNLVSESGLYDLIMQSRCLSQSTMKATEQSATTLKNLPKKAS